MAKGNKYEKPIETRFSLAFEDLFKEFEQASVMRKKSMLLLILDNTIPFCYNFNVDKAVLSGFPDEAHLTEQIKECLEEFKERFSEVSIIDCDSCGKTILAGEIYTDESGNTHCKDCNPSR